MSQPCAASTCTHTLRDTETDTGQQLCTPCVHTIRRWLASIPNTLVVLAASTHRETTGSPVRSGTRTPDGPGRGDTLNILGPWAAGTVHDPHGDQTGHPPIAATLYGWVQLLSEEQRYLNPPATVSETALAAWLDRHLERAARQPWAGEMHAELREMMGRVWHITSTRPITRAVTRPCPRCDGLTLTRTDGDLYVRCSECETSWTEAELAADAGRRAAAAA
ncbi:hypothetical protein LG634_24750 [Streptomyces bambusae]|uniref:hypothetical protein n=1 Tax=Streptomyces bambusae TaxID=1550616 RepID=UPI001CFEB46D|nr:hypothetical protein [Streptomyces bambusae]MCB5168023.1 hypothetical protein [Streptomyces bambusae]